MYVIKLNELSSVLNCLQVDGKCLATDKMKGKRKRERGREREEEKEKKGIYTFCSQVKATLKLNTPRQNAIKIMKDTLCNIFIEMEMCFEPSSKIESVANKNRSNFFDFILIIQIKFFRILCTKRFTFDHIKILCV